MLTSVDCIVLPEREVELASPTPGILDQILVERDEFIVTNQLVAVLKSDLERVSVELARLNASDQSELRIADTRLAYEVELLTNAERLSGQNHISGQTLSERRAEHALRVSELAQARQALERRKLELAEAEVRLARREIRSPISGRILERLLEPGEYLREDTPVVRIGKIDRLRVEIILPQDAYRQIMPGTGATIWPELGPDQGVSTVVEVVDPVIDPASGTFGVLLYLDNSQEQLVAGVNCDAEFQIGS